MSCATNHLAAPGSMDQQLVELQRILREEPPRGALRLFRLFAPSSSSSNASHTATQPVRLFNHSVPPLPDAPFFLQLVRLHLPARPSRRLLLLGAYAANHVPGHLVHARISPPPPSPQSRQNHFPAARPAPPRSPELPAPFHFVSARVPLLRLLQHPERHVNQSKSLQDRAKHGLLLLSKALPYLIRRPSFPWANCSKNLTWNTPRSSRSISVGCDVQQMMSSTYCERRV